MMIVPDSQDSAERYIGMVRSPLTGRILVVFSIFAIVWLHQTSPSAVPHSSDKKKEVHLSLYQDHSNLTERCVDASDVAACQCADPIHPSRRIKPNKALWDKHHERLVQIAESAQGRELDFVIIGDSITERWGLGTRGMGKKPAPEFKETFDRLFDKSKGGKLQGLALASTGDTSTELLWHLQNGMLPENLKPKVWIILIGTNDLGRGCSKNNTLTAIVQVAKYVHMRQPQVPILVHALLPRRDMGTKSYALGTMWKQILWINRNLKRFCADSSETWYYMEARKLFLKPGLGGDNDTDIEIDELVMKDGVHPTVRGYEKWGPKIASQVKTLIKVLY